MWFHLLAKDSESFTVPKEGASRLQPSLQYADQRNLDLFAGFIMANDDILALPQTQYERHRSLHSWDGEHSQFASQ